MSTTNTITPAKPVILVAGQDISTEGLRELLIVENISGLYRCEALFGNMGNVNGKRGFLYFDRKASISANLSRSNTGQRCFLMGVLCVWKATSPKQVKQG